MRAETLLKFNARGLCFFSESMFSFNQQKVIMENTSNTMLWYQAVGLPSENTMGLPIMSLEPGERVSYDAGIKLYRTPPGYLPMPPGAALYTISRTFFEWCRLPTVFTPPCKAQELTFFVRVPARLGGHGMSLATSISNIEREFTRPPPPPPMYRLF